MKPVKGSILIKQGERHKRRWKKHLFLLEGEYLYYFESESDEQPRGVIFIRGARIREEAAVGESRRARCFSVRAAVGWSLVSRDVFTDRTYFFCTDSYFELNEWMALLIKASRSLL